MGVFLLGTQLSAGVRDGMHDGCGAYGNHGRVGRTWSNHLMKNVVEEIQQPGSECLA